MAYSHEPIQLYLCVSTLMSLQDSIRFFFGGSKQSYGLADILPQRFGPADLLTDPNTPLLLQPQHNPLELTAGSHSTCRVHAVWLHMG